MSPSSSSGRHTREKSGFLGVGAKVSSRRVKSLLGLVLESAPDSSWLVYWYDLDKTSRCKFNQLVVENSPSQDCLGQVGIMCKVLQNCVDFATDNELQKYVKEVESTLEDLKEPRKLPASPSVTRKKPSAIVSPPAPSKKLPPAPSPLLQTPHARKRGFQSGK